MKTLKKCKYEDKDIQLQIIYKSFGVFITLKVEIKKITIRAFDKKICLTWGQTKLSKPCSHLRSFFSLNSHKVLNSRKEQLIMYFKRALIERY